MFLRQGAPIEQLEEGPIGAENDLLQTMNLLLPDENYTVPHLKFQPLSPTTEKSPHLAIVGGSFTHQLISLMVQNNHIRISRFDYFNLGRSEFSEQGMLSSSGAFEEVSLEEEFFSRDGVILEVNENMISGEHLRKFLNFVLRDR